MEAIYITNSPEETIRLGKNLAARLMSGDTVLLYGELGQGKTHFIKGVAEGLGVEAVIKSPTYAYVNKFTIHDSRFTIQRLHLFHYDLYRFEKGADVSSIGLEESINDPNAINVIEWADRLDGNLPDRYISVNFTGENTERSIEIHFISPSILTADKIEDYYSEWVTPMHVRAHSRNVAKVAMDIAGAYIKKGIIVNTDLLYPAGMLHDVNRVCDFRDIVRDKFKEEVTEEKWDKWVRMREKYKGMHHADITAKILNERGYTETAEVIRLHKSLCIVTEPQSFDTIEKKILYYADKRVKHDEIVSLKERFRDGKERYGKFDTPEERKKFDEVETMTKKLEKELFRVIGIKPESII